MKYYIKKGSELIRQNTVKISVQLFHHYQHRDIMNECRLDQVVIIYISRERGNQQN